MVPVALIRRAIMKTRRTKRQKQVGKRSAKQAKRAEPSKRPARAAKPSARTRSKQAVPKRAAGIKRGRTKSLRAKRPLAKPAPKLVRARTPFALCIPIWVPVRHRAPPVSEQVDPPPPPAVVQPQPAVGAPLGVRIGRLPPRASATLPAPAPVRAPPPLVSEPKLPAPERPPITPSTWQEVERAALRLGIEALRPDQRRVIRAALEGRDALVSLPSGSGKSACYLVPALLLRQPVLVVSGRPRLLRSQCDRLLQRRIPVAWLDARAGREQAQALAQIAAGGPLVVLCTPEALQNAAIVSALRNRGLSLAVVDGAQAVSEWSDELRPACAGLAETMLELGRPPVLALVGAATPATRHDIRSALALQHPELVEGPALRENLALDAVECRGEVRQRLLVELVMRLRRPGIVYCTTPREVDAVYAALSALRLPVHRYHAQIPAGERLGEQLNFLLPGRRSIMVATSGFSACGSMAGLGEAELVERAPDGFGLGLDKRDLRFVIHYGSPASLEQYAREVGLAGRDGDSATAVLLHAPEDRSRSEALIAQLRLVPAHVLDLGRGRGQDALDNGSVTLEALALSAGLSRRTTELVAEALEDAGAIVRTGGWARVVVDVPALFERARRLSAWLETLRKQDMHRLGSVVAYCANLGCRSAYLARYFGAASSGARCGCAACQPGMHPVASAGAGSDELPRRRPPALEFSVTRAGQLREPSRPLTAKLGDFGALAARSR
jgi:ATP-dependent DNA helicase RecQ